MVASIPWIWSSLDFFVAAVFISYCRSQILTAGIAQWYSSGSRAGWSGFDSPRGLGIFLFTTASRPALGPTQPPIQWVSGAFSLGVKRPMREVDHSPTSSDEVKTAWSYTSTPQYTFIAWWGSFTLPLFPNIRMRPLTCIDNASDFSEVSFQASSCMCQSLQVSRQAQIDGRSSGC
jgi:hypothetical protein